MGRASSSLLAAIAIVAYLLALSAGAASGVGPEAGTVVRVELELRTSNGLRAHLENSEDGTVTLELRRKGQVVTYEKAGEATEAGLEVRFGRLGLLDVAFDPTRRLDSTEPGPGCSGAPRTLREGFYAGTIRFAGERGFVRIRATRARGTMSVISQWRCPGAEAHDPYSRASRPPRTAASGDGGNRRAATLIAASRGCSCDFVARVRRRGDARGSVFFGVAREEREGMRIERASEVRGPTSAFELDRLAGTATLGPPSPFSGRGSFEARPGRRGLWRSTIRVPLLGAAPIDTGAPGFRAILDQG